MIEHYSFAHILGPALFLVGLLSFWAHKHFQPTLPLPPGPPSEFLLGHTRVIPKENAAKVYSRWSKEYNSDIIHVRSLGRSTIVLHSAEVAKDILEKKGANFCDRPRFTLLEVNEAHRTVKAIMARPGTWQTSLRRFAVAIVLQVSYGTEVPSDDDPYIRIANDAMHATGNGGVPANSVVDLVPFVRYLPDWLVNDWSLQFARQWRWAITKLHDVPFTAAQAKRGKNQEWSLDDIKGAAGAVFIAGADTTWATCVIFVLNMVLHPEIQKKAQDELDAVIGPGKLPEFSDRPSLPYIEHIVQEIYRWSPLAPLGIPHKSLHDDVYQGMLIPKGTGAITFFDIIDIMTTKTVVYANSYAIAHDERVYKAPHDFNPDRYSAGEPYPVGNFGFGRRICVGRFLADNSVWIMVATMLSTLNFCKKVAQDGRPIEPRVRFTNGGTWPADEVTDDPSHQSPRTLRL
ncbi:hypothetical protein FPOAC1_008585 [Fusarium poae]|uniref:hypothetical protein n=1 Tax=Fusarium poae TaxID=36050 RepID=UPI001CE7776F|nr:hypothetical protein FPOAC1_008585 [Fusarium poae]KAG8669197.1 hypothetical protein FPOAC1_008585 [Fusarium poae]